MEFAIHQVLLHSLAEPVSKKSSLQNCEALQSERFFCKTSKNTVVRLTPTMVFLRSIAGKDPIWSVSIPM
jgi:hypothetical protein